MYDIIIKSQKVEITAEGASVTVSPSVVTDIEGAEMTVSYATDNGNVTLKKNEDGSATLTGMINGKTVLSVYSDYDRSYKKDIEVIISGQRNLSAYYGISMFMIGNSILRHPPHSAWIGGPQGADAWGMAASERSNDYAHMLAETYMHRKYGDIRYTILAFGDFERSIKAEDEVDYSKEEAFKKIITTLRNIPNVPNVITLQMGENVKAPVTAEQYASAITQLATAMLAEAPMAQIILCTPWFANQNKIDGVKLAASELGLRYICIHPLTDIKYQAPEIGPICGTHPGDLGHRAIAEMLYEQINITLTENVTPKYAVNPERIEISADAKTINEAFGALALSVSAFPSLASNLVKWSVDNPHIATVDEAGVLTAINNGTVKVCAISCLDQNVSASYTVEIEGQTPCYSVTYASAAEDIVNNLPKTDVYVKGGYIPSSGVPERKYHIFEGWTQELVGKNIINEIEVTQDTTLYAVWREAREWSFNIDGYAEGIQTKNGFNVKVEHGVLQALNTQQLTEEQVGEPLEIISPELNIDATSVCKFTINVQNTVRNDDTQFKLVIYTTNGSHEFCKPVTTTEVTSYIFDLNGVSGIINGFKLVPTNVDCAVVISNMRFE